MPVKTYEIRPGNAALEAAIDEAGRDRVLTRALSYGWTAHDSPPEWVWRGIIREVCEGAPPPYRPPATDTLFGFTLI